MLGIGVFFVGSIATRGAHADETCRDDAAARLRSVAFGQADAATGLEATKLYLETLNAIGSAQKRTECFDDMARDVPVLREKWCSDASGQTSSESCLLVHTVHWDIVRLRAQRLVEEADKTGGLEVAPLYERGGQIYAEAFREACETPVRATKKPLLLRASSCEELAYNAARAFVAAHVRAKAITLYRSLVAYGELVGTTPLVGRAMHDLAESYQAIALYDAAAEWHERYATLFPKEHYADQSMSDAVILRLGLGDLDLAIKDADFFLKTWGKTKRSESSAITLAIALDHAERGETEKARVRLAAGMDSFDRGPIDLRVAAHATFAKVAPTRAKAEWAIVRALWADPRQAEQRLRAAWPAEDQGRVDRRLGKTLHAVGEALLFAADEKRTAEVDVLRYPAFTGTADRAGVEAFVNDKVKDWFEKKRTAIAATEPEYIKVLEVQPLPALKPVIGASAGVAKMWAALADDLSRAPVDDAWRRDRALYRAYLTAAAPMIQQARVMRAKPAMKKCVELAVKYQLADSPARDCELWLVKNFPDEYRPVDEIVPGLRAGPRAMPASPLPARLDLR